MIFEISSQLNTLLRPYRAEPKLLTPEALISIEKEILDILQKEMRDLPKHAPNKGLTRSQFYRKWSLSCHQDHELKDFVINEELVIAAATMAYINSIFDNKNYFFHLLTTAYTAASEVDLTDFISDIREHPQTHALKRFPKPIQYSIIAIATVGSALAATTLHALSLIERFSTFALNNMALLSKASDTDTLTLPQWLPASFHNLSANILSPLKRIVMNTTPETNSKIRNQILKYSYPLRVLLGVLLGALSSLTLMVNTLASPLFSYHAAQSFMTSIYRFANSSLDLVHAISQPTHFVYKSYKAAANLFAQLTGKKAIVPVPLAIQDVEPQPEQAQPLPPLHFEDKSAEISEEKVIDLSKENAENSDMDISADESAENYTSHKIS